MTAVEPGSISHSHQNDARSGATAVASRQAHGGDRPLVLRDGAEHQSESGGL